MYKKVFKVFTFFTAFLTISFFSNIKAEAAHFSGGFSSVNGIQYTFTSGTASGYQGYVTYAANSWSAQSSNVSLNLNTGKNANGIYVAQIVVSVMEYTDSNPDLLGLTIPYKSYTANSASEATKSDTWVKAFAYVYKSPHFNTGTSDERILKIRHTLTHEMGHTLSVAHCAPTVTAVMKQGCLNFYSLKSYDINSLRAKWGT